ncbi:MAG: GGDEF domain-containing protein [Synechococcaceae bacterium WB4_1_0192]|nr:GGDEF domain-containing protein [Synechococcaceae bacterium WB4_1_0192]
MDLQTSLSPDTRFLKGLLIAYWLGSATLLALLFAAVDLVERHREVLYDAEHARDTVAATFAAPISADARQGLIQSYSGAFREDELDGLNVLLVINQQGRILYSSRPNWRGLLVTDQQVNRSETDDPDFRAMVACFRNGKDSCTELRSMDVRLRPSSFTVLRSIELPQRDIGIKHQHVLVAMNYDPGVVFTDYSQGLLYSFLFSLALSGVLTLLLWPVLTARLLPELVEASQTDGLTDLSNRSLFMEQAKLLLAEAEEEGTDFVFAILDIDHFKRINDSHGHVCGDKALSHVARIISTVTRADDLVCRFGGEEFALLLHGSREDAGRQLDRLRLQLEMTRLNHAGNQIKVQASIGAACSNACGYNIDFLYNTADKALYQAKQAGRNRLEWSDGRMLSRLAR